VLGGGGGGGWARCGGLLGVGGIERMCTGFVWAYIVTQFIYNLEEGVELCTVQFFITKYVFKNIF